MSTICLFAVGLRSPPFLALLYILGVLESAHCISQVPLASGFSRHCYHWELKQEIRKWEEASCFWGLWIGSYWKLLRDMGGDIGFKQSGEDSYLFKVSLRWAEILVGKTRTIGSNRTAAGIAQGLLSIITFFFQLLNTKPFFSSYPSNTYIINSPD